MITRRITTIRRVLLSKEAPTSATTIHHHQIHHRHHSTFQRSKSNFLFNNNMRVGKLSSIRPRYLGMTASITTTFLSSATCWPIATICGFQQQQQQQQPYFSNFPSSSSSLSNHRMISSTTRNYATMENNNNNNNEKEITTEEESTDEEESTTNNYIKNFATSYHAPVMWKECIDGLLDCQRSKERQGNNNDKSTSSSDSSKSLIFIDGTLGGGGHSAALLEKLQPGDIVIGCDVDPMALQTASERLEDYIVQDGDSSPKNPNHGPYFIPVQTNFGNLVSALSQVKHPITQQPIISTTEDDGGGGGVDGILLDLGVSSFQIDTPERGFAFMKDGPLDMRMNNNNNNDNKDGGGSGGGGGLTASDICNEFDQTELQRIFSQYGDEPKSKTIARAIINHRPILTTKQLTDAIASVTPKFVKRNKRMGQTATFARIFQSLRIVVNNEDGVLRQVFEDACPTLLRQGGRLVVLSYHSMEDRATKRIMRDGSIDATSRRRQQQDQRDIYGNYIGPKKPFKPIGKRQKATEEEIVQNSRARSASLRIAEKQ